MSLCDKIFNKPKYELDDNVFGLRPSSIDLFFTNPSIWYKQYILGETANTFEGNTGSVLGTVLHYCYECALTNKKLSQEDVDNAIGEYAAKCNVFDERLVKSLYPTILPVVLEEYINPFRRRGLTCRIEERLRLDVSPTFTLTGTADFIYNTTIVDWKNVSTKPNTDSIPFKYKIQLLAYALMLREQGQCVEYIEVVYAVRPTKTLGARCYPVKMRITQEDWKMIEDTVNLIEQSVSVCRSNPELIHLIFKSMNLKQEVSSGRNI